VLLKDGEAWLLGSHITPLTTASTHVIADPVRTRKLLLNARELDKLAAAVQQKGYACVCLSWYWSKHLVKCEIALGKGKKDTTSVTPSASAIPTVNCIAPCATRARKNNPCAAVA